MFNQVLGTGYWA